MWIKSTPGFTSLARCLHRSLSTQEIVNGRILHICLEAARNTSFTVTFTVPPLAAVSVAPVL